MKTAVQSRDFKRSEGAMSLMEILLVVALVAVMATLVMPAFVAIAQGSGMKRAILGVSDSLEQARTEAMAQSTWVLVGFSQDATSVPQNLTVMTMASRDGTTNTAPANLMPLSKPIKVDNVQILPSSLTSTNPILKGSQFEFTSTVAGASRRFYGTVIAFSPQGEAILTNSTVSSWIEIPLQELRGNTPITNKTASIRVSGVSGQVIVNY